MWVQELLVSGLVHEVNKFSKFLHGTATLMPQTVEHAPYWFDDASIAHSILAAHVPPSQPIGATTSNSSSSEATPANVDTELGAF